MRRMAVPVRLPQEPEEVSGPPKDVSPGDLWSKLTERPRPTCDFQFPGKDKEGGPLPPCKLRILTESELAACRANATKFAATMLSDPDPKAQKTAVDPSSVGYQELYYNELSVQLATLACRDATDPKFQIFANSNMARSALTTDEFGLLARSYALFRIDSGPLVSEMNEAECDAWIDRLMEGAARSPLSRLSLEALTDLIVRLVSKLKNSPTGNTSPGAPQENSSSAAPQSLASASLVTDAERENLE